MADLRRRAALPVAFHVTARPGAEAALATALPEGQSIGGGLGLSSSQDGKLALLSRLTALGDLIADIDIQPPSLEDIYSHFSQRAGQ